MCSEYTHFHTGLILVCLVALCNKIKAMTIELGFRIGRLNMFLGGPLRELMMSCDMEITSKLQADAIMNPLSWIC